MKLNISNLVERGYIEYQDANNDIKYYISSYQKNIDGIKINVDVFKSIRGGLLFKVRYYYKDFNIYKLNTKDINIYDIEYLATTIDKDIIRSIYSC